MEQNNIEEPAPVAPQPNLLTEDSIIHAYPIYGGGNPPPAIHGYFRAGHSVDYLPEIDALFVYGGYLEPQKLHVLYNVKSVITPDANKEPYWEEVKLDKIKGRAGHISFIRDGKFNIYGGYNDDGLLLDFAQVDYKTFETKPIPYKEMFLNTERRWACGINIDNKLFVHGGWNSRGPLDDMLMLNLDEMKWETQVQLGDVPSARRWHNLSQMHSQQQRYLLYGGYDGNYYKLLSDTHILNLPTMTWERVDVKGNVPPPSTRHQIMNVNDKQMLMIGGQDEARRSHKEIYFLNTDEMRWTQLKNTKSLFDIKRHAHKAVKIDEHIILIGGGYVGGYVEPFYWIDMRML
jgi:hypothetical protein